MAENLKAESKGRGPAAGIYAKLENGFFGILDFFENKGIPVYNYVEFLENKGIPVFPFTAGIIAVIITALWFLFFSAPGSIFLTVNFIDDAKHSVNDVSLSVIGSVDGGIYYSKTTDSATRIELKGVGIGTKLKLTAVKEGFESVEEEIIVNAGEVSKTLELAKKIGILTAKIKLIDAETGQLIKDAEVTAEFEGKTIPGQPDSNGSYSFLGIPEGTPIKLSIKADGYGSSEKLLSFDSENPSTINLAPDAEGRIGNTNITFRVMDAETSQLIDGALVKVFDKDSGKELTSDVAVQGELLVQLEKGKTIKWTASKEGYAGFDSSDNMDFLTLRKEEESITIRLQKGGRTITVSAIDKENSTVLSEALITLFNSQGEKLDANITGFGGFAEFKDLNVENDYYASAVKEGFLPEGMKISPKTSAAFQLSLERALAGLTANVSIFVIDVRESPVPGASLKFFEQTETDLIPLGFADAETDVSGYYGMAFKAGINLYVEAVKDTAKGDANALLEASSMNRIEIQILAPSNIVEFFFQDSAGYPTNEGRVKITSDSGSILFDGNIENASVMFDTLGNKTVHLSVELPDGTLFEESIKITGEPKQTITLGKAGIEGFAPEIRLVGLENANGEKVEGLVRGQEGFLVFETIWPDSNEFKSGVHVRVGSDGIKNAESQDIAVLGFNAEAKSSFLGRTFNPTPSPGNASIDYSNNGEAGKASKFLELYFENPKGTKIIKVRVKLSDTSALKQEVHYRAWGIIDRQYYRAPIDAVIGTEEYSKQKLGLYAETINEEITVFESEKTSCTKEACASFSFLDSGFNIFQAKDFKAVKDNVYALEIALSGKDTVNALINALTSKENPKIGFQGSDVDVFAEMPDINSSDSSIEVKDIIVEKGKESKARIYFKALKAGNSNISLQITAGSATISQNLPFNIFEEKNLTAEFNPKAMQEMGKDFTINVNSEDKQPVENAAIVFKNNAGNEISRTLGNAGNGKNGKYKIKNIFNAGLLNIEITASGFRPLIASYMISQPGVLIMPESLEIKIPSKERTASLDLEIRNSSNSEINNLSIEQVKTGNFDNAFSLENSQISALAANSAQKIQLTATYNGNAEKSSAELTLKASGIMGENIPVKAETKIILNYNQKLDSSCLEFYPQALQATLFFNPLENSSGAYGSAYSNNAYSSSPYNSQYSNSSPYYNNTFNQGYSMPSYNDRFAGYSPYQNTYASSYSTKQVPLTLKNNCDEELILSGTAIPQGVADDGLSIAIPEVSLQKGEQQTINIDIENRLGRQFYNLKAANYALQFKAEQLQKSLPLTVNIMSIRFAIQAPDSLNIFIIGRGESSAPMYVRNIGNAAIENLRFELGGGYGEGVQLRIIPEAGMPVLPPGQAVMPPPLVVAAADVEKSKVLRQIIDIKGTIDGREYPLKRVNVFINVSTPGCLKASPQEIDMIEEAVGLGAKTSEITISNYCLEDARITALEPLNIGNNALSYIGSTGAGIIPVNGKAKFQLRLSKNDEIDTTVSLTFFGALSRSGRRVQTDPVNLTVKLGKSAVGDSDEGITSTQAEIQECEDSTKKVSVKFPKVASSNDCSNGYCDAEQLANFIAGKIAKKVSDAEQAIIAKNKSPEGTCLEARACSFSELGAKPETFTVYFQNDLLSTELLRSKLENDSYSSIKGFQVDYFSGTETDVLKVIAGRGFGRKILIPQFKGCGKYRIRIDGAVDVAANQIQSGRESVAVFLLEKKQTAECTAKVQNFQNFLPADASLSVSSPQGSWLGIVSSEPGLEESGKEIAQQLFGKPERFASIASNKLMLGKKSIPQGIVEINVEFNDYPTQPVTVNAFVRQEALSDEAQKKEVLKEAARAINGLKSNSPAAGSCITADGKTLRIASAVESFGELTLGPCVQEFKHEAGKPAEKTSAENTLKVSPEKETCCNFTVSGNLANQKIGLRLEKPETSFNGLHWDKTGVKAKEGSNSLSQGLEANLKTKETKTGIGKDSKKETVNSAEFQLCATGGKQFVSANNNSLTIKAFDKSLVNAEQKPTTNEVKLMACAIHPFDLVDELTQAKPEAGKSKDFYAVASWKGNVNADPRNPEKTTIGEVAKIMEQDPKLREKLHGKHFFESQSGTSSVDFQSGKIELGTNAFKPIGAYLAACGVSHVAGDLILSLVPLMQYKLLSTIPSTLLDCGIPTIGAGISVYKNELKSDPKALMAVIDKALSLTGADAANEILKSTKSESEQLKQINERRDFAFKLGAITSTIRGAFLNKYTKAAAKWLAEKIITGTKGTAAFSEKITGGDAIYNEVSDMRGKLTAFTRAETEKTRAEAYSRSLTGLRGRAGAQQILSAQQDLTDAKTTLKEAEKALEESRKAALTAIESAKGNIKTEMEALGKDLETVKGGLADKTRKAIAGNDTMFKELDALAGEVRAANTPARISTALTRADTLKNASKLSRPITIPGVGGTAPTVVPGGANALTAKQAEKIAKDALAKTVAKPLEYRPWLYKLKNFSKVGSFLKAAGNIGGSIGVGIAANYVGWIVYDKVRKNPESQKLKDKIVIDCPENKGWQCELLKNQLYKISVTEPKKGEIHWNISRFDDSLGKIPEGAEWVEKCDGSSEKPLTAEGYLNEGKKTEAEKPAATAKPKP